MEEKPNCGEEHYSLRWNNHQAHLLHSFEALLHAETLVDVTLVCAERRVRAHKVLLGACSPFFERIFSENPCKHPVIVLNDFQGWEVQAVVDFMYRGEVSVAQEQLTTVIRAGESLQVRGLAEQERGEELTRTSPQSPPASAAHSPAAASPPPASPASPQPRRKQARPRRRSGEAESPENLSMRRSPTGLKAVRLARPRSPPKTEPDEEAEPAPPPPRIYPTHQDLFPTVPHAHSLTTPHMPYLQSFNKTMFGLDAPIGLFPSGLDHKMYPLPMDMDPRTQQMDTPLFTNVKKKCENQTSVVRIDELRDIVRISETPIRRPNRTANPNRSRRRRATGRPKGQHSAPRGGPPRSWTNAELTEALQQVWNKKMTTSQASRVYGIPYNSLLMYVRGKYGKSLKLEQLRKDCIASPLEVINMNSGNNNNNHPSKHHDKEDMHGARPASSESDIASNPMFNPFPPAFYPEFQGGFPIPLNMMPLMQPSDKARELYHSMPLALEALSGALKDEDCKSDRSKENSADEDGEPYRAQHVPQHPRPAETRPMLHHNGQD